MKKLNMKKFVCNGTKDNSNMPLDIEEKKGGWEEEKEGEKNGWMKIADWGLWYWCLAGQSWYCVVYSVLGLTECNCSGLHMVDQIVFLLIIQFYIFSWTFLFSGDQKMNMFLYAMIKKVHHGFIFPRDSVRYSGVSCQLSA